MRPTPSSPHTGISRTAGLAAATSTASTATSTAVVSSRTPDAERDARIVALRVQATQQDRRGQSTYQDTRRVSRQTSARLAEERRLRLQTIDATAEPSSGLPTWLWALFGGGALAGAGTVIYLKTRKRST